MSKRWLVPTLALLMLPAGVSLARSEGRASGAGVQAPPTPEFSSAITVVSLPVFVTDKGGRSVEGLKQDDFVVEDEGKPVEIVGFRSIDAGDPEAAEALKDSPAARRHFMLLFDLSFTSIDGLVRSRGAAIEFVTKQLRVLDFASVATFSANHGLQFLVGFTSDKEQLTQAIKTLGVVQLDRQADPLGLAYDLRELGATAADTLPQEGGDGGTFRDLLVRFRAAEEAHYRERVLSLVDSLGQLGRLLDSLQGRKQVLFLSSGFDDTVLLGSGGLQASVGGTRAFEDSEAIVRGRPWEVSSNKRFGDSGVRHELVRALQGFAASDAVIHTVDLGGLRTAGDVRQQAVDPDRRGGRESLSEVADLSGGRFYRNTNDLTPVFAEIAELSRHYYLLAFEPRDPRGPGRFHKLRVRLKPKGLQTSHRSGYFERAPNDQKTALARRFEVAEIVTKGIERDDLSVSVLALPYRPAGADIILPVVLELDGPSLLGQQDEPLELEIHGYAFDEAGAVRDTAAQFSRVDPQRASSRLREGGLQCHITFRLKPGLYNLRFLVQDTRSGRIGSKWLEVSVPTFDAQEVFLSPPLFMDAPDRWVILEVQSRASQGLSEQPFKAGETFTPKVEPQLVNGQEQRVCVLAFDAARRYDPGASFEIEPRLLDGAGRSVSVGPVALSQAITGDDGLRRYVLTFTPDGLRPGPYTFRVGLRDPSSGRVSEAYQSVRVE